MSRLSELGSPVNIEIGSAELLSEIHFYRFKNIAACCCTPLPPVPFRTNDASWSIFRRIYGSRPQAVHSIMEVSSTLRVSSLRLGRAVVEPARNRISCGNGSHRVARRDMDVLMHLVQNGTQVVGRQEILDAVWHDTIVNDEALTLAVSRLRKAFDDNSRTPSIIETIPKRGYRLMMPATIVTEPSVQRSTLRFVRSPQFWVVVLVVMLAFMTALFAIVRQEYGVVSATAGDTDTPTVAAD